MLVSRVTYSVLRFFKKWQKSSFSRKKKRKKVRGAMMISRESLEIEETIENLMANQLVLSRELKDQLLNPDLDIADYFD